MFRLWRKFCCNEELLIEIRGGIGYHLARQFPISSSNFGSKLKSKCGRKKKSERRQKKEQEERARRNKLEEISGLWSEARTKILRGDSFGVPWVGIWVLKNYNSPKSRKTQIGPKCYQVIAIRVELDLSSNSNRFRSVVLMCRECYYLPAFLRLSSVEFPSMQNSNRDQMLLFHSSSCSSTFKTFM